MKVLRAYPERKEILLIKNVKLNKIYTRVICSFVLLLTLDLIGCGSQYVVGDWFSVIGEIEDNQGQQLNTCEISLQNRAGKMLQAPSRIPGKFHKAFVVPDKKLDYIVSISCPRYKVYQTRITYGENVTPVQPLKLGVIVMEPV